ncbi:MAG: 50S ribosomal protein L24 [Candidatus Hadarchaeales archaeon]
MAEGGRDSLDDCVIEMSSKQPRKQRLAIYSAPFHIRRKLLSAPLSDELQKKHGRKSIPVRKGDRVKILRGDFAGLEGEVVRVDLKKSRIYVEAASTAKADGTQVLRPIHPSKVVLLSLVEDKERGLKVG